MSRSPDDVEVLEFPDEARFVVRSQDAEAELIYRVDGTTMRLVHTEVPDALGGRGIGGHLVTAAVERAAADGLAVAPWCPFAREFLQRHPDLAASVTVDWSAPRAVTSHGSRGGSRSGSGGGADHGDPHTEEHLDEQERESFPASDPHSDWAGLDQV